MVKKTQKKQVVKHQQQQCNTCVICLQRLACAKIPCHHKFCLKCIISWSKKNLTCPLCRKNYRIAKHGCKKLALYKLPSDNKPQPSQIRSPILQPPRPGFRLLPQRREIMPSYLSYQPAQFAPVAMTNNQFPPWNYLYLFNTYAPYLAYNQMAWGSAFFQ